MISTVQLTTQVKLVLEMMMTGIKMGDLMPWETSLKGTGTMTSVSPMQPTTGGEMRPLLLASFRAASVLLVTLSATMSHGQTTMPAEPPVLRRQSSWAAVAALRSTLSEDRRLEADLLRRIIECTQEIAAVPIEKMEDDETWHLGDELARLLAESTERIGIHVVTAVLADCQENDQVFQATMRVILQHGDYRFEDLPLLCMVYRQTVWIERDDKWVRPMSRKRMDIKLARSRVLSRILIISESDSGDLDKLRGRASKVREALPVLQNILQVAMKSQTIKEIGRRPILAACLIDTTHDVEKFKNVQGALR